MTWSPSHRITKVQSPVIPLVGQWIAQHPGTISLGQGVVHYAPPPEVVEAIANAVNDDSLGRYGAVIGREQLLALIHSKLTNENKLKLQASTIVCTAGSNMAFMNAIQSIADVGDEIILFSPYYFNHEMAIGIAGCNAVIVPTTENYQIDFVRLEKAVTSRTRAIVTISPNNPTGSVYPDSALRQVNQLCRDRAIYHISDEAYEYFHFDGTHFSPGSIEGADRYTITLFSLSKSYGMAGWRVGYMVIPTELELAVKKIQDTNLICPPIMSQLAGVAALQAGREWVFEQNRNLLSVRELVLSQLAALGERVRVPKPEGAFYALIETDTTQTDMEIVQRLIRDYGVATMPGSTFGVTDRTALRVAFGSLQSDTVAEGMGRLVRGLVEIL